MNKDIGIQEKIKQYPGLQEKINISISKVAKKWKDNYYNESSNELMNYIDEYLQGYIDYQDQIEEAMNVMIHLQDKYSISNQRLVEYYHKLINNK